MPANIVNKKLYIQNMTCINCERRIERELQELPGIIEVSVSYVSGTANLTYDESIVSIEEIEKCLERIDYHARKEYLKNREPDREGIEGEERTSYSASKPQKDFSNITGTLIILLAIYFIAWKIGLLNIFYHFPVAKEGMGYGMLFIIGLLTSIHCVAMCGGICMSQSIPKKDANEGKSGTIKPSILYNAGRVISYTVIGGTVGAIGSVISFSGTAKGMVQILAGIFMMIMGINMLGIIPWLRRLNPRIPKVLAKRINSHKSGHGPFYIGLLNGLMPCGPLQAMQLYALSTGSPIKGALSMLLFSIGTVPLLFAFGALSTFLNKKFTSKMMTVSAVLVVVLGIFMLNNGMSLSGFKVPALTSGTVDTAAKATLEEDVQVVTSGISSGKYEPIVVQKGIPVKWTIQAENGDINGCNNSIIIKEYGIEKPLSIGDNVIEFIPTESGTVPFSCWMGMIRSRIVVVDDLNNVDNSKIDEDTTQSNANTSTGGCCGTDTGAGSDYGIDFDYSSLEGKKIPTSELAIAEMKDNLQTVTINYDNSGFSPAVIVVQKGIKTRWIIEGSKETTDTSILFPAYSAELLMEEGENPINFIPSQDFDFFTEDGSYVGYVKVVDDISQIDKAAIQKEISEYDPAVNYEL